jgi:hypothetical protein
MWQPVAAGVVVVVMDEVEMPSDDDDMARVGLFPRLPNNNDVYPVYVLVIFVVSFYLSLHLSVRIPIYRQ